MHIKTDHNSTSPRPRVNTLLAAVLVASFSLAAIPAQASIAIDDTAKVRIQAFELDAPNSTVRIYKKLSAKAERSCATAGRATLLDRRLEETCTVKLLNDFVVDLNDSDVTDYHQLAVAQ